MRIDDEMQHAEEDVGQADGKIHKAQMRNRAYDRILL